jgi:hypothetical protein
MKRNSPAERTAEVEVFGRQLTAEEARLLAPALGTIVVVVAAIVFMLILLIGMASPGVIRR